METQQKSTANSARTPAQDNRTQHPARRNTAPHFKANTPWPHATIYLFCHWQVFTACKAAVNSHVQVRLSKHACICVCQQSLPCRQAGCAVQSQLQHILQHHLQVTHTSFECIEVIIPPTTGGNQVPGTQQGRPLKIRQWCAANRAQTAGAMRSATALMAVQLAAAALTL